MSENVRDNIPSQNEEQDTEEGSDHTQALVPVDQRAVDFYGEEVVAVMVEENGQQQIYVPLRALCDYLGLNWSGQLQRIRREPVLQRGQRVCVIHTRQRGDVPAICLRLNLLAGWLFGVSASRVKPELRAKIERYQEECYDILSRAFQTDAITTTDVPPRSDAIAELEQVRAMGLAIARMAEQQIEIERRTAATEQRLDNAAAYVQSLNQRLTVVEKRTAPQQVISDEQAEEVASAVKALAEYLTTKNPAEKWYQSVYNALYKQFGVTSYKRIRKGQLEQVMTFLEDWRTSVDTAPQTDAQDT